MNVYECLQNYKESIKVFNCGNREDWTKSQANPINIKGQSI